MNYIIDGNAGAKKENIKQVIKYKRYKYFIWGKPELAHYPEENPYDGTDHVFNICEKDEIFIQVNGSNTYKTNTREEIYNRLIIPKKRFVFNGS